MGESSEAGQDSLAVKPADTQGRRLTGKVAPERIACLDFPRPTQAIIKRFLAITDLVCTVSDAMDEIGIVGVVPADVLKPMLPGTRLVGPALTLRNSPQSVPPSIGARKRVSKQGDIEAHNLARRGDVLVIEGVAGVSSLGGNSATLGRRQGEAGAIVDGATRDVATARRIGYPVWARGVSPLTGKWRLETTALNSTVHIAGVQVNAGDLVIADDNGICFVPRLSIEDVLKRAEELSAGEDERSRDVEAGMDAIEVAKKRYFKPVR